MERIGLLPMLTFSFNFAGIQPRGYAVIKFPEFFSLGCREKDGETIAKDKINKRAIFPFINSNKVGIYNFVDKEAGLFSNFSLCYG